MVLFVCLMSIKADKRGHMRPRDKAWGSWCGNDPHLGALGVLGPACPAPQVKEHLAVRPMGLFGIACGSGNPSVPGPFLVLKGQVSRPPPAGP